MSVSAIFRNRLFSVFTQEDYEDIVLNDHRNQGRLSVCVDFIENTDFPCDHHVVNRVCVCVCVQVARCLYRDESRKKERTLLVKISPTEQLGRSQ